MDSFMITKEIHWNGKVITLALLFEKTCQSFLWHWNCLRNMRVANKPAAVPLHYLLYLHTLPIVITDGNLQCISQKFLQKMSLLFDTLLWYLNICAFTMTSLWVWWHLKSQLFTQLFVQVQIKGNIKAPCYWPLWGEFTSDRWIACT